MFSKRNGAFSGILRGAAVVLATGLLCLMLPKAAKASLGTGTITADQVNMRSDAGVSAARIVSLPKGTQAVVESVKADPVGKYWYQLTLTLNGKSYSGYVLGDYVYYTPADEGSSQTQKSGKKKKKKAAENGVTEVAVPGEIVEAVEAQEKKGETKKTENKGTQEEAQNNTSSQQAAAEDGYSKNAKARSTGDYIRVRTTPVTGDVVGTLRIGKKVTLKGRKTGSDGQVWYKIRYKENGSFIKGYVRSDLLAIIRKKSADTTDTEKKSEVKILTKAEFEKAMNDEGFPESYKDQLRALHKAHPAWTFKAVKTGLGWNDALAAESRIGLNLVAKGSIASWKSTQPAAFNWRNNTWYTFDGGSWVAASEALIAYYMDPRNFLTESQIYQFESLEYEDYQDLDGIKSLLAGTFMKGNYTEPDGTAKSYAETFLQVGKSVDVNPYHLAVRCYQEQGQGTSESISGKVVGFENIFNYFNIGAYASGKNTPTRQGLFFASQTSSGSANYCRPWNSRYQSILGGASYLAERYVKAGQNTLYFQKFNVVNSANGLYKHQYMANVQAAGSEGSRMYKAYAGRDSVLVFYIPVYTGMPESAAPRPTQDLNNNDYLLGIYLNGEPVSASFNGGVTEYNVTVKKKVKTATLTADAAASTSVVSGLGDFDLERGDNAFVITCTSAAGTEKKYTLNIKRK